MNQTPLYNWHLAHGAKLVEFGGFMMPVSYGSGVLAEHQAVRERCGLFDISHMGEIWVQGPKALEFLNWITTNDVGACAVGRAQYSLLLYPHGGVVDDIIIYRAGPERFMLCVNAANIQKDLAWLLEHRSDGVDIEDRSATTGMIALQGPKSLAVLAQLGWSVADLPRFAWRELSFQSKPVWVARTGYTGEDGVECFVDNESVVPLWQAMVEAGAGQGLLPIGLGARDTLRLEMGYPLYGHELSSEINPLEARLGWVVKMEKGEFVGRSALDAVKQKGLARKMFGLTLVEPGIPREGLAVVQNNQPVGKILSGTFSPTLKVGIATALLDLAAFSEQEEILIDIRGKLKKAKIVPLPFVSKAKGSIGVFP